MKIGIVTVTYNSVAVIDGFLHSVLGQTHADFVLYVVDNASSDGSVERVGRYTDARIRVIANQKNCGIAEGNNQGIRSAISAGCDSVLLVNNDTEFSSTLLETLVRGLEEYGCDMIAPKIVFYDKQQTIWSAGGGFNPWRGYSGFHYGVGQEDDGQFDTPRLVDHAPACCLLVRKEVFARIGLIDEHFFVYVEDTDFSYRAKRAGLKLLYYPFAVLLHKASTLTGGTTSDFTVRYCTRNQVYFMLKHFGLWRALYYLLLFEIYQAFKLLAHKVSFSGFWLRQKAFAEGFRVWRQSVTQ
ncbi:MAG TPA: glycosyltransferase family 2 protein [Terriglobales bacterium]|nr:glycosyltransferase family 2 protein [Terriglobales bacterium]